jgi:pimeloyl-ACP methyl ester carboxylesterase
VDETTVDIGAGRLHVETLAEGREPAIVLLHGFGASSTTWAPLAPGLAATGRRVVAFDRLGFGRSDRPRRPRGGWGPAGSPYRPSVAGRHTLAVLDGLAIGSAVLVGHSAGAVAAVLAALEAPARVAGLGLVAPALLSEGPPPLVAAAFSVPGAAVVAPWVLRRSAGLLVRGLRSTWHDPAGVTAEVVDRYREPLRRPGWEHALVEMTRAVERLRLADRLPQVAAPAVVVAGASDRIVKPRDARRIADLLGGPTSLVVVPDAGHLVHEEQPAAVRDALIAGLGLAPPA